MLDILIVAGGTGGHVYPALALALDLVEHGKSVRFLTDRRGVKYLEGHEKSLNIVVLPLDRKGAGMMGLFKLIVQFILSFFVSLKYVLQTKQVMGFSGFPTFATLVAGIVLRRRLYAHEQNAVLGKVNRVLAAFLTQIFTSTKTLSKVPTKAQRKITFVGMPVRADIAALADQPYAVPQQAVNILVTGGSQGAHSFSDVIPKSIALLPSSLQRRLYITHQARKIDQNHAQGLYEKTSIGHLEIVPFIDDMAGALGRAHLAIIRSGASTIAEVSAAGRPAIMVPYPFATDDHQAFNAQEVMKVGGGWILLQEAFQPESLAVLLEDLLTHPKKLLVASQQVKLGYEKNSIKRLAQSLYFV